jgi:hypothetical protein
LKDNIARLDVFDWIILLTIGTVLGMEFLVAIISPPNNVDSLLYHMSRVVHWAQNGAISHYSTAYEHQLYMPIWAESAILHLRVLFGSDRLSNLVQWFSFFGSTIIVASIAKLLGCNRRGQLLAALVAVTIPMGLLQSSSTQNDLVVAYWVCSLAFLVLRGFVEKLNKNDLYFIGVVTGLGMLTKVTFYMYALPFGIALFWILLRDLPFARVTHRLVPPLAIILIINFGYWTRNLRTYGTILGPRELIHEYTFINAEQNQYLSESQHTETGVIPSRIKQMVLWHAAVPLSYFRYTSSAVDRFLFVILDDFQYAELDLVLWNHEDTAGNPIHLMLLGVALLLLPFRKIWGGQQRQLLIYAGLILASYFLLAIVISNSASIYGLRFQLPFFVLAAPLVAGSIQSIPWKAIRGLLIISLMVSCIPWLLFNNTRPVVGWQPWITRVGSVFTTRSEDLLFAMRKNAKDEYEMVTTRIKDQSCESVELVLDSHDYEYTFWYLLQAPQSGVRLERVSFIPRLAQYHDPDFNSCAVICTSCKDQTSYEGKSLVSDYGSIQLFLKE